MTNVLKFRKLPEIKEKSPQKIRHFFHPRIIKPHSYAPRVSRIGRSESLTLLDLKNAEARATWVRRYFSGSFCDDHRSGQEQVAFDEWYQPRMAEARNYLRGAHGD